MFKMKIDGQYNAIDRTLICGTPNTKIVPLKLKINGQYFKLIGRSYGGDLANISLEIEKTNKNLIDQIAYGE